MDSFMDIKNEYQSFYLSGVFILIMASVIFVMEYLSVFFFKPNIYHEPNTAIYMYEAIAEGIVMSNSEV